MVLILKVHWVLTVPIILNIEIESKNSCDNDRENSKSTENVDLTTKDQKSKGRKISALIFWPYFLI